MIPIKFGSSTDDDDPSTPSSPASSKRAIIAAVVVVVVLLVVGGGATGAYFWMNSCAEREVTASAPVKPKEQLKQVDGDGKARAVGAKRTEKKKLEEDKKKKGE
jgi:hypothetical protein